MATDVDSTTTFEDIQREEELKLEQLKEEAADVDYTHSALSSDEADAILEEAITCFWSGDLKQADSVLRPYVRSDLSISATYVESAMWQMNLMAASDEAQAEVERRLAVAEAMAASAVAALGVASSSLFGGWFGGGAAADDARTAALDANALLRAQLEALGALAFLPMMRGALALRHGTKLDLVKGAYYVRRSWKAFAYAHEFMQTAEQKSADVRAPQQVRALLELGIAAFHFFVSLVPPSLLWLVELIGFKADRSAALVTLERIRGVAWPFLKRREVTLLTAAINHFFLANEAAARAMLDTLLDETSGTLSPFLLAVDAFWQRQTGNVPRAIERYTEALESDKIASLALFLAISCYHRGSCFFLLNDWQRAVDDLEHFLAHTTGKQFKPYAAFMLGFALCQLDADAHRARVVALYEQLPSFVRPNQSYDAYALRKSRAFLANDNRFSDFDTIFIAAYGLHHAQRFADAIRVLDQVKPLLKADKSETNRDAHAQFYWLRGSCLRGMQRADKSRAFLEKAVQQDAYLHDERFVVPYALFELGELAAADDDFDAAAALYERAARYRPSGYDWEKILATRISAAKDKLKQKRAAAAKQAE